MRKLLLFVAAFLFVAANINAQDAEKLTGTLTSSMNYYTYDGGYPLTNANDGNYSTKFWSNDNQHVDDHVTMTLSSVAKIGEIKLYFADGDKPAAAAVEVSIDNSDWQSVATFVTDDIVSNTYTCDALGVTAQYVRMRFTEAKTTWFQLMEFEVYESPVEVEARTISVSVNDDTMGSAYIGTEGTTSVSDQTGAVRITAVPATGYKFVNWTLNGEEVATTETFVDGTEGSKEYVANFVAKEVYQVSVSVNDAIMGTADASAEGQVYEGTVVTLVATANDGYEFVNWTVDGTVVSDDATFTTTIGANIEFKANFKLIPERLTISAAESSMQHYNAYTADKMIDGSYTSYFDTNYTQSKYATDDVTVTVTLAEEGVVGDVKIYFKDSYRPTAAKMQVSTDGATWIDVAGSEFLGSDAESTANGYLIALDLKGVSAKYVRMFVTEKAATYLSIREFEVYEYPVEVESRTVSVSVNDDTMGVAYIGAEGTTSVSDQTGAVKLTAVANEGFEFVNWTLGTEVVATLPTYIDKTAGDKEYVANFVALAKYNVGVSVNDATMGSVEASATGEVFKYTEVTFTATPSEGYEFVNWTVGDSIVSKVNPLTVTVESDVEYKANFRIIPTKLAIESMTSSPATYSSITNLYDGSYTSNIYMYGPSSVEITATLAEESVVGEVKFYFDYSYGATSGKLQVSTDGETWTDVEGASFVKTDITYEEKSKKYVATVDAKATSAKYVRLYADQFNSYYFYMYEFEVFEAPVNVAPRTISVSVNDDTMGTAYIGAEGTTEVVDQTGAVRLAAAPNGIGYKFVNWTVEGEEVATTPAFVDRTEGDKAYVANFVVKPQFAVSVSSASESKGTVEVTQTGDVYEGEEVTFTATAVDGYKFVHWLKDDAVLTGANPYTVTVTEAISLVAVFERDPELNRSAWTVYDVSSEYAGLDGTQYVTGDKAIDGSLSTYWHTDWDNAANKTMPQWIVFDLGAVKSFDSFNYVSRSESQTANGNINEYKIYVSDEAPSKDALTSEMTEVHSGAFTYPGQEHKVTLTNAARGRYVMLYATSSYGEGGTNMFANCAEFYLYCNSYTVSVSSSNPEIGTAYIGEEGVTTASCSVEGTDVVTLTAQPIAGYRFVNWTLNGEVVSTEAVYTTPAITESCEYVAAFEFEPLEPRTVKVASNDKTKGYAVFVSPMPEGTATDVTTGEIVTVEAIAQSSDDFFVNWTINGVEVGTETTYEYLGAEAATIQANFISKYVVTIDQVAGGTINVKSGGAFVASGDRVLEGNYITFDVTENTGSQLKKLFVNGEDVFMQYKYNADYCVQVNGPMTITAEYGEPVCIFTYECTGNGWIEAWEYDTYDAEAEENGELELPLSPDGAQYAYGDEIPFGGTAAIFPIAGAGDELVSLTINGEEIDMTEEGDLAIYGDHFIDPVDAPIHVIAVFTGTSTGVESAEVTETSIYAVAGGVQVEVAEATTVSVYSIAGTLVAEQQVSESAVIALTKGVYIVKTAEKVVKVVVK